MKSKRTVRTGTRPAAAPVNLPAYCNFNCPHAAFGDRDVAGDCRREQAVFCKLLKQYNNKNNKCLVPIHAPASGVER